MMRGGGGGGGHGGPWGILNATDEKPKVTWVLIETRHEDTHGLTSG